MKITNQFDLPENFILIQSEGSINDSKFIDYKKPFARIFKNNIELLEANDDKNTFIDCSKSDLEAIKAAIQNKNIGLIKH